MNKVIAHQPTKPDAWLGPSQEFFATRMKCVMADVTFRRIVEGDVAEINGLIDAVVMEQYEHLLPKGHTTTEHIDARNTGWVAVAGGNIVGVVVA